MDIEQVTEEYFVSFPKRQCPLCCCLSKETVYYLPEEILENIFENVGPVALAISKKIGKKIAPKVFASVCETYSPKTPSYLLVHYDHNFGHSYGTAYTNDQIIFSYLYNSNEYDADTYMFNNPRYEEYALKRQHIKYFNPVQITGVLFERAKILNNIFNSEININNIKNTVLSKFLSKFSNADMKSVEIFGYCIMIAKTLNMININYRFFEQNNNAFNLLHNESKQLKLNVMTQFGTFIETFEI
jgi:hypothetical protein